jgi:FixJ family two-component response regulator
MEQAPVIHIVDDDAVVLRSLARLLGAAGHRCATHGDAEAFLASHDPDAPGCAILDLGLPGMDGFAVQQQLAACGAGRAVIFLTGAGDIPASVRAMKAGAVDFLTKPVEAAALLSAVAQALDRDAAARAARAGEDEVRRNLARLTPREREVLDGVLAGQLNKQIAWDLGTAEKTVKVHRGRMMKKMGVRTVADLIRIVTAHGTLGQLSPGVPRD